MSKPESRYRRQCCEATGKAAFQHGHNRSRQELPIAKPQPINRRWLPLNALRAFDAVGLRLSFTAGAEALNVSQSAVSRHIISLEELIGRKLFDRSGARLALTPEGEALLPVVTASFDRIEARMNSICRADSSSRPIRIHVPPSLLQHVVLPMIRDFHAEHADIKIDVSSSHVTGLPSNIIDMAIVFDRPNVDDRVTDLLSMVRVAPACSARTAVHQEGQPLETFLAENNLLHCTLDGEPRGVLWSLYARQMGITIDADRGIAFDTLSLAATYAMSADGIVLADIDMFADDFANGRLVMPYDAIIEDGFGYYLKLRPEDLSDPAIGLFRTWLINRFVERNAHRPGAAAGSSAQWLDDEAAVADIAQA
jgi:LysR family glycine cleavage system transcriptional activator